LAFGQTERAQQRNRRVVDNARSANNASSTNRWWGEMSERRLRTKVRKMRNRAHFWDNHGERIRLVMIGGGVVLLASAVMKVALG
jgi:hypothetical protein